MLTIGVRVGKYITRCSTADINMDEEQAQDLWAEHEAALGYVHQKGIKIKKQGNVIFGIKYCRNSTENAIVVIITCAYP